MPEMQTVPVQSRSDEIVAARKKILARATSLTRAVLSAVPQCPRCQNGHHIAEMGWHAEFLVLIAVRCSECDFSTLSTYLAAPKSRAVEFGEGWILRES